jgi:hypothetical protein
LKLQVRGFADVVIETEVKAAEHVFPIYSFAFGGKDPKLPRVLFTGGVHGLERVGTNVAISFLKTIIELLKWDKSLQHLISQCRLICMPLLNPAGMFSKTRANPNGVDLMRNAPINAEVKPNIALVGGHRLSPALPWYRGPGDMPMEREAQALEAVVRRELFPAPFSMALDLHSGFGVVDRLWFPYAYTHRPFERIDLMYALKVRLDRSLPNHFYLMEPQSASYLTHGDLWDHFYTEHSRQSDAGVFLPLALEMGSWLWIKKNPRQIFSALGIFNPVLPHRLQRTLRRHLALLDFILRAAVSHENWASSERLSAGNSQSKALELWY